MNGAGHRPAARRAQGGLALSAHRGRASVARGAARRVSTKCRCWCETWRIIQVLEIALVENIQREELNPIEEASAYRRLVSELGYSQEQVASRVGKDRSTVANLLRLLRLPRSVRAIPHRATKSSRPATPVRCCRSRAGEQQLEIATEQVVDQRSERSRSRAAGANGQGATEAKPAKKRARRKHSRSGAQRMEQMHSGPRCAFKPTGARRESAGSGGD